MQRYLIGNGVTDEKFDGNALVPFAHGMGLIPEEMFEIKIKPLVIACLLTHHHHLNILINSL